MRTITTLLMLLVLPCFLLAQSNEGQTFWFGFMEHRDINENRKVAMITAKSNTVGTISIPGQGWSRSFSVQSNEVALVQLPASAETLGSERITQTGILLESADPVSVYIHQYFAQRSEATVVLPEETLGQSYFVMTYEGVLINNQVYPSEFLIVATQDETRIRMKLSDRTLGGRNRGESLEVVLDAGESYQVQAAAASGDLTGTSVEGDKPFAVFGGNRWTEVPTGCQFRDNLLEQMYPVEAYGRQFISVPSANVSGNVFRILAAEDNTQIEVQGSTLRNYTLDAGAFVEYSESIASFIRGDKPILVAQFNTGVNCSGYGLGDPSMLLLNSIEQTRDTVTLFNSSFENITENYINIITRTVDTDFVLFDGSPLISQGFNFSPVPSNPEFSFAQVRVNSGAHTIISEGCGVIASAYGYGDVESYAYSGGASFSKINANPIAEGGCVNDTLFFDSSLSPVRYNFQWDLGDGTTSTEARFPKVYTSVGEYPVRVIIEDECLETIDTIDRMVQITEPQTISTPPRIQVCAGDLLNLTVSELPGARYQWQGPNGFNTSARTPEITSVSSANAGTYRVVGTVAGCTTSPSETMVSITQLPQPNLGSDTLLCYRDYPEGFVLKPGLFSTYRWSNGARSPELRTLTEGIYTVEVTNMQGCIGIDSVQLTDQCPTKVFAPNAFSPNLDGVNDTFQLFGTDIEAMELKVFDRWGNLLFESTDLDNGWDGFYGGREMGLGSYTWTAVIQGFNEKGEAVETVLSGSVQLIR